MALGRILTTSAILVEVGLAIGLSAHGTIRTMNLLRFLLLVGSFALLISPADCQTKEEISLRELVIGRETFFDFGPPFQYLDLYLVKRNNTGINLERVSLTPEANKCDAPAKVEFVEKSSPISLEEVLLGKDPCQIPEKKLRSESKKQRKAMGFSGANLVFRVMCGSQIRTLHSGIGDKDWFAEKPNTPSNTSWTMQVLERLGNIAGPTAMDKPMFDLNLRTEKISPITDDLVVQKLSAGNYDDLFPDTQLKASEIYKASLVRPPSPTVELVDSTPIKPTAFTLPEYPKLPRLANHQGWARLHLVVAGDGTISRTTIYEGSPLFEGPVRDALKSWKFPPGTPERDVTISLDFKLNCDSASH